MIIDRCIQNIVKILEDNEPEEGRQLVSTDDITAWFMQNKDETIHLSAVSGSSLKLKAMLWNLENLRPPVRSKFESTLIARFYSDTMAAPLADGIVSEASEARSDIVENEPVSLTVQSVEEKTIASGKDNIQHLPAMKEDWFDKILSVVSAFVQRIQGSRIKQI